jgi:low temperature requirement protein LtrA
MPGSLLRERVHGRHAPVTHLELFFDLVFVFAITQVSHYLLAHLTLVGGLQAALLLMSVWWAWIYTAWITNWLDPENTFVRSMVFVLMAVGLVMSTSLADAFEGRALPFAAAYVTVQLGRTLFMAWAIRKNASLERNFQRVAIWFAVTAVLWISGAMVEGQLRLALWAVALGLEYASPATGFWVPGMGRTATSEWTVEGSHLAERCSLFVIICLGESILITGATFAGLAWTAPVMAAFACALVASIAMWWIYFSAHADAASEAIAASDDPGRIARLAYTYMHIPLVAGIVLSAAGDELVLAHPDGHVTAITATVLIGGPALFLAGALLFKFSIFRIVAPSRAGGLVLLIALIPAAQFTTPLGLTALTSGVLVAVCVWEAILRLRGLMPIPRHPQT